MPTRAEIDAAKEEMRRNGIPGAAPPAPARQNAAPSRAEVDAIKDQYRGMSIAQVIEAMGPSGGAREPEKSLGRQALDAVVSVAEGIDSVTGAPTRAAIQRTIDDSRRHESMVPGPEGLPKAFRVAGRAAEAFASQFGEDPNKAPTGKEIASNLGLSDKATIGVPGLPFYQVSPAGVAGLGVDVAADPTNILPVAWIAKTTAKGVAAGGKAAAKAAYRGAKAAPVSGTAIETAEKVGSRVGEMISRITSPTQAKDWPELKLTAQELGIDPMSLPAEHEFGPRGKITNLEKSLRQGGDSDKWVKGFEDKLNETREAAKDVVNWIGRGQVLSAEDGGKLLRSAYEVGREKFFDDLATSYDKIGSEYTLHELAPKAQSDLVGKLNRLERELTGASQDVTTAQKGQTREALKTVAELKALALSKGVNAQGYPVFNQVVAKLRGIGRAAFPRKNELLSNPPNVAVYGRLYNDVREALIDTIRLDTAEGEKLADALKAANETQHKFFSDTSILKDIGDPNVADEALFRKLVYNGNSRTLDAIKDLWQRAKLPDISYDRLKGAFVNEVLDRASKGPDTLLSFRTAGNVMKDKRFQLERLLNPEELDKLTRVVRFGDRFGEMYLNNSGTGAFLSLQHLRDFMLGTASNEAALEVLKRRARGAKKAAPPTTPPPGAPAPRSKLLPTRTDAMIFGAEKAAGGASKLISTGGDNGR